MRLDRNQAWLAQYNLSYQDAWDMWNTQQGRCDLCTELLDSKFHVDHDHVSGDVRAFVHAPCNHKIGSWTVNTIDTLVNYLRGAEWLELEGMTDTRPPGTVALGPSQFNAKYGHVE